MADDSVYRVTEVIGVSSESWEQAAKNAVEAAGESVRELRIAEVVRQDVTIEDGKVSGFRVRLGISFKYEKQSPRTPGTQCGRLRRSRPRRASTFSSPAEDRRRERSSPRDRSPPRSGS